jgi:hypothetical protein
MANARARRAAIDISWSEEQSAAVVRFVSATSRHRGAFTDQQRNELKNLGLHNEQVKRLEGSAGGDGVTGASITTPARTYRQSLTPARTRASAATTLPSSMRWSWQGPRLCVDALAGLRNKI